MDLSTALLACAVTVVGGHAPARAQPTTAYTSLAEVTVDADGDRVPDALGRTVRLRAVVTSDPFEAQPGPLHRIYLDDGTGGLMLQTTEAGLLDGVRSANVVEIDGQVDFYNASPIVVPRRVRVVGTGEIPPPIDVTVADLATDRYEGRRIRARGKLVNAQNVELRDRTGAVRVRARRALLEDTDFSKRLYSGAYVEIVGIASQYDPSPPYDAGYRIEMLSTADLVAKVDYRPYAWVVALALFTGFLWWRARTATRREAYTRELLEQVRTSERALKDSETRMRVVAEATSDVIWELDLERRELTWHAGARKLFQSDRAGPRPGQDTHLEFVHEDDAGRIRRSLQRAIDDARGHWAEDYRIVRRDTQVRHVSDRARILTGPDGVANRVIGAIVDVTEKHVAEQRARELKTKMEHAQRLESLGILSTGIAHDFNNILAAIVGSADILRESESLSEGQRTLLDEISRACDRGVDLTGKMLTYAGRAPTQRKAVDINQLVEDVAGMLGKIVSKSVVLECDLDPQAPRVEGDQAQLQQVIMNFITNAVESLPHGRGEVRVTTRVGDVQSVDGYSVGNRFSPGRYVSLEVTDTGTGIAAGEESKIFEPFFTTKASGRGLGLSAVVGIIHAHGGSLFLDSKPGRGTRFTALLPASESVPRESREIDAPAPVRRECGRVLIADDEAVIADLVARAIAPIANGVEIVADGRVALERILASPNDHDLLILDVSMPGLNGDEVFSRARRAGVTTPVLFISGHGAHDLEQRIGSATGVEILAKPFRLDALRERCARLLAGTAPGEPASLH